MPHTRHSRTCSSNPVQSIEQQNEQRMEWEVAKVVAKEAVMAVAVKVVVAMAAEMVVVVMGEVVEEVEMAVVEMEAAVTVAAQEAVEMEAEAMAEVMAVAMVEVERAAETEARHLLRPRSILQREESSLDHKSIRGQRHGRLVPTCDAPRRMNAHIAPIPKQTRRRDHSRYSCSLRAHERCKAEHHTAGNGHLLVPR